MSMRESAFTDLARSAIRVKDRIIPDEAMLGKMLGKICGKDEKSWARPSRRECRRRVRVRARESVSSRLSQWHTISRTELAELTR